MTDIDYVKFIDISYADCQSNVVPIESYLGDLQVKYTRILPLILFLFEMYIFKNLLSLNYRRIFCRNL